MENNLTPPEGDEFYNYVPFTYQEMANASPEDKLDGIEQGLRNMYEQYTSALDEKALDDRFTAINAGISIMDSLARKPYAMEYFKVAKERGGLTGFFLNQAVDSRRDLEDEYQEMAQPQDERPREMFSMPEEKFDSEVNNSKVDLSKYGF